MSKLRKQYSLQLLMGLVVALGLPLALVKPLYAVLPILVGIILVFVVEGLTLTEVLVIVGVCGFLTGLLIPTVQASGRPGRRVAIPPVFATPAPSQSTL